MAYQRINITRLSETLQELDKQVAEGDHSRFIHAAIHAYLAQIQKEKLRQQLREGAVRRADRDYPGHHLSILVSEISRVATRLRHRD